MTKTTPHISVNYGSNGRSTTSNELGMRPRKVSVMPPVKLTKTKREI
jgi:hypothetical protein